MLINYLKIALRSIAKNRFYSFLNIAGLAIGIAAFVFIFLYVRNELTYDKYHQHADRIYRIESDFTISGKHDQFAIVPVPMGPALKIEFPEIEQFCRFAPAGNEVFKYNDKEFYEERFYFADSTVFEVFTHKMIMGNPKTSLVEPYSIVISENVAAKYFGSQNPMGEMIETGDGEKYKVTGVLENVPSNAHLRFDALISGTTIAAVQGVDNFNSMEPNRFWNIGVFTYILLAENSDMATIHEKFGGFYNKYMKPVGDQISASFNLMSTPLLKTHFYSNLSADLPKGNVTFIYIFSIVAVFILLIAAINYMNMATARSARRAREVGIRKVAGAFKRQLIVQFLTESILLAIISLIIALVLVHSLLPNFNTLSGKEIGFDIFTNPTLILIILGVTLFIGFVSGSYPAFYLSSFLPVKVLKGSNRGGNSKGGLLRRILVVFQFFIAIVMIIGTIVVSGQINYLKDKDLGFIKDNMIILELQDTAFRNKAESLKKELLKNSNIHGVTNSTGIPGNNRWIQVVKIEKDGQMTDNAMILALVDFDFVKTYGLEIVTGRDFNREMGTDATEAVIVNEATVKQYGWTDDPLGKKIIWGADLDGTGGRLLKVVGVVKDYHYNSLHNKVEPIMLFISERPRFYMTVKVNPENFDQTIKYVEEKWNAFGAKRPFNYQRLTDTWDEMYESEQKLGVIFRIATILTIFIALLGLLGLSSFIAEQKTKEIGIRKVMGATLGNILGLLYKEFIFLIIIAFIIAIPVAWWRLDIWLETSFVYHINITVSYFLLAGLLAITISLLTLSYHTIKAAMGNPVDAIKYE